MYIYMTFKKIVLFYLGRRSKNILEEFRKNFSFRNV